MEFKFYLNDKPVIITDTLTAAHKRLSGKTTTAFVQAGSGLTFKQLESEVQPENKEIALIVATDTEALKASLFKDHTMIEAAGGVVQNERKEILFIFRRGKWDLPKGKMDKGETPELCAEREIEEETGVRNLKRKKKIGETYHVYTEKKAGLLKLTHWYYFTAASKQELLAQAEEDIEIVEWVPTTNVSKPMANTYASIREIMQEFFDVP